MENYREEPEFLCEWEEIETIEKLKEIEQIISQKPKVYSKESLFLKKFTLSLYNVFKDEYLKVHPEIKKEIKPIIKTEIPKVRMETQIEAPKPKAETPKIIESPPILKPLEIPKPKFPEHSLVVTKDTGQVLVKANLKGDIYELVEPVLLENEGDLLNLLKEKIGKKIFKKPNLVEDKKWMLSNFNEYAKKMKMGMSEELYQKLKYYLIRDIIGFGRIDTLLKDRFITEIYCDGAEKNIEILYEGKKLSTNLVYKDMNEIEALIQKFANLSKVKLKDETVFNTSLRGLSLRAIRGMNIVSSRYILKK